MSTKPTIAQLPAQRVARATQSINEPAACPQCGSIYFFEINASMYTPRGSTFTSISTGTQKVFLCPCGELIETGYQSAPAGSERDWFNQSLKQALTYRKEHAPEAVAQKLIGLAEFNKLEARLATLEKLFLGSEDVDEQENEEEIPVEVKKTVIKEDVGQNSDTLVPKGNRGRSEASSVAGAFAGDGKIVTVAPRKVGSAQSLRRQGGGE